LPNINIQLIPLKSAEQHVLLQIKQGLRSNKTLQNEDIMISIW